MMMLVFFRALFDFSERQELKQEQWADVELIRREGKRIMVQWTGERHTPVVSLLLVRILP